MMDGPRPSVGQRLDALLTPLPIVDEERLAANIARVQSYMDAHGLGFRPHIKTHKIPALGEMQRLAGASGINCQKVTEAEIFADRGFNDILITYNIVGKAKLDRLVALNERVADLKVVADSMETIEGLSRSVSGRRPLKVLVECDTGGGRCGVQSPKEAVQLATMIHEAAGLIFTGLATYPKPNGEAETETFLRDAVGALKAVQIACPIVSNGGTPSLFRAHLVPSATEHRAGTYIYNDRSMVRARHASLDDCAMHIMATVVSRPTPDRAVVDAGSKTLSSDLMGFDDFGHVIDYPQARITSLSEEHGVLDLSRCGASRPAIGDRLRIVPNHACVVSNLFDFMTFHRRGAVTRVLDVLARGLVW